MTSHDKNMRKNKGLTEPIYLVEVSATTGSGEEERQFIVMGTKEKEYKVKIKSKPTCTCMDYIMRAKHNDYFCKHIYFIVKRVLKCTDQICDKKKFQKKHLEELFDQIATIPQNVIYNGDKMCLDGSTPATSRKAIGEEDCCPICLDELLDGNDLVYCMLSCGNSLHHTCFNMWCLKKKEQLCVYCRGNWKKQQPMTKDKVVEQLEQIAKNEGDGNSGPGDTSNEVKLDEVKSDNINTDTNTVEKKVEDRITMKPKQVKKALEYLNDETVEKLNLAGLDWLAGKALSKEISNRWKGMTDDQQKVYYDLSEKDQERFDIQNKQYTEKGYYIDNTSVVVNGTAEVVQAKVSEVSVVDGNKKKKKKGK